MKDNRFLELLNLYIDRQITAAETAELEAEMQASPRRRAHYRQYCQMHRATKAVYESFRAHAVEPSATSATNRGVIANFENQRRRRSYGWVHYAGGLVAAACLALAFVRFYAPVAPAAAREITKAETLPAVETIVAAMPVRVEMEQPVGPTSLRNLATAEPNYQEMLMALRQEEKRAFESGQIQPGRLTSLFDDGVFDSRSVLPANGPRVYRSKQVPAQQVEFTAFQFQR